MKKIAIIDGDSIPYTISYRNRNTNNEKTIEKSVKDFIEDFYKFDIKDCDYIYPFLKTGGKNYRNNITINSTEYKAHRKEKNKSQLEYEKHIPIIKQMLLENHNFIPFNRAMEVDDIVNIYSNYFKKNNQKHLIVHWDKDLNCIEGEHLICGRKGNKRVLVDYFGKLEFENKKCTGYGLIWKYYQLIKGDVADEIKGIKGMGDKKTYELLKNIKTEEELKEITLNLYNNMIEKENMDSETFNKTYKLISLLEDDKNEDYIAIEEQDILKENIFDYKPVKNGFYR